MTLTNDGLRWEHPNSIGGVQRFYRWGWWGLSAINAPMAHPYEYAWEFAIISIKGESDDDEWELRYDTPLTQDVVVTYSDEEANAFITRARQWFEQEAAERMGL